MRLESVDAFPISLKADESLRGGSFSYSRYKTVLVRAVVDGSEGWGEAMTRSDPEATAILVKYLARGIVGGEYGEVSEAWEKVWRDLRARGHTRGVDVEALSGMELAFYDAFGKISRKPLSKIMSPNPATTVPVFAGSLFSSRGPLDKQVDLARERGLRGAKVKIGFGVEEDLGILKSVRRFWEEAMLVADANGAYDAPMARKACDAFGDQRLEWFEEPVLSDDFDGYASLKGTRVKIGAGETWFVGDFRRPIEDRIVDVIEPSVSRCGGLGIEMDVARRASKAGIKFSPMTGMNSVISLAASIHAAAAAGSVGVEFNPFANPLQTEVATGLAEPRNGQISVPAGDGLGLTVDERFVKSHSK